LKLLQARERGTPVTKENGERIIKKSELGETQYVSANYIVRNKTVISKHVFAGNQRIASTVSMKNNCGTMTEQNTMYFHPDHLGSSSYVTDKKGNFFEMIEYLPYGETLYDEAATVDKTEFRFTSKEQDAETGLYYHGARYRDAKTGVWLSVDPYLANGNYFPVPPVNDKARERNKKLPGMGGVFNSVNMNAYHYAGNNPVRYVDPDGKKYVLPAKKGYSLEDRTVPTKIEDVVAKLKSNEKFKNYMKEFACAQTAAIIKASSSGDGDMSKMYPLNKLHTGASETIKATVEIKQSEIKVGDLITYNVRPEREKETSITGHIATVYDIITLNGKAVGYKVVEGHTKDAPQTTQIIWANQLDHGIDSRGHTPFPFIDGHDSDLEFHSVRRWITPLK